MTRCAAAVLLAALQTAFPALPALADCTLISGPRTAALVELYTSEGCSSCPPADQFLRRLGGNESVVPLALHVDYWDYLGWRDPFSAPMHGRRQEWLTHRNGHRTVYTPHFFVSGTELRDWHPGMEDLLRRLAAQPARARIQVEARLQQPPHLLLAAAAQSAAPGPLELMLAVTQNALVTTVPAGENRGVTLRHDHVVRQWLGPVPLTQGAASTRGQIPLDASWGPGQVGVTAFVQNASTGEVLQAIGGDGCGSAPPAR